MIESSVTISETTELLVPPHRKNPAAERVYAKAEFTLFTGMRSWYGHKVMELPRAKYEGEGLCVD